jgi:hypothetical protein
MEFRNAAERVHKTFWRWKRLQVPDKTAFYHTALDIAYRRGGLPERLALRRLRYQRSALRGRLLHLRDRMGRLFQFGPRLRS